MSEKSELQPIPSDQLATVIPESLKIEYFIYDDNPKSVFNLCIDMEHLHRGMIELRDNFPELLTRTEAEFEDDIEFKATATLSRLRLAFWAEYENAVSRNRISMNTRQIIGGIVTLQTFHSIIKKPKNLAFILCPPTDYVAQVTEALHVGMENIRKIASARVVDQSGKMDTKAAEAVLKAVAMLDLRVKGAIIQRIDQRTLNVQVKSKPLTQLPTDPAELDRLIEEAKASLISSAQKAVGPSTVERTLNEIEIRPSQVSKQVLRSALVGDDE